MHWWLHLFIVILPTSFDKQTLINMGRSRSVDTVPSSSFLPSLQIIMDELYRNIMLAFACIFVTTLLMLSSLVACLQVLLAVVLTLLNVSGMMYFWGE